MNPLEVTGIEQKFLQEINSGLREEVMPYYADWLEDQDRSGEAQFWRRVLKERWCPLRRLLSTGGVILRKCEQKAFSYDWDSHMGGYLGDHGNTLVDTTRILPDSLVELIPPDHEREQEMHFRESLSILEAYQRLLKAFLLWPEKDL